MEAVIVVVTEFLFGLGASALIQLDRAANSEIGIPEEVVDLPTERTLQQVRPPPTGHPARRAGVPVAVPTCLQWHSLGTNDWSDGTKWASVK